MEKIKLSPENWTKLLEAERGLTDVMTELDKAEKCGIDCTTRREALRNQLRMIAAMKQEFAPY